MTIYGKEKDFKPIVKVNDRKYIISWNKKEEILESTGDKKAPVDKVFSWDTIELTYKPTPNKIKELVYNKINQQVEFIITNCFIWNVYKVYLTKENQADYKMYYDLAFQTNGESLPVTVKFEKSGKDEYYTFDLLSEFTDFYTKMVKHINKSLSDCWKIKENFHIEDYME